VEVTRPAYITALVQILTCCQLLPPDNISGYTPKVHSNFNLLLPGWVLYVSDFCTQAGGAAPYIIEKFPYMHAGNKAHCAKSWPQETSTDRQSYNYWRWTEHQAWIKCDGKVSWKHDVKQENLDNGDFCNFHWLRNTRGNL
jgi:hypothetical protein